MQFLTSVPRMGKGDWIPFGIMGIVAILTMLFPHVMTFVAYGWLTFVVIGLGRSKFHGNGMEWRKAMMLFLVFNVPTATVLVIARFR